MTQTPQICESTVPLVPLRIWPGAVVLILLILTRFAMMLAPEPSFGTFMLSVFGPLVCAILILGWWWFASRAKLRERTITTIILVLVAGISMIPLDVTLKGFGVMLYSLPAGMAMFTLGLLLFARAGSKVRITATMLATLAGFGIWDFIRNDGVTGDFRPEFHWRTTPTAEQTFLTSRSKIDSPKLAEEKLGEILWSDFRGPQRNGIVANVTLKTDWEATPPKEIWKHKIGPSWSSFVMAGNRLYTQEQRGEMEAVVCYRADDGREEWSQESPTRFWESVAGAGPRATPTLHEGALYALGAKGLLQRLDPLTGEVVWRKDLHIDGGRPEPPNWGYSSSPLVTHDTVIVHAGGTDTRGLFGYDAASGDLRWSVPCGDHSYASAQLATLNDQELVLMLTNEGLTAVDPSTGKVTWDYAWLSPKAYRVVQPLILDKNEVVLGTGAGIGTRRISISSERNTNGQPTFTTKWTTLEMKPGFNDYVPYEGALYGFDASFFACIDLETGKKRWKKGRYGNGQVLLLSQAGQLLIVAESGELVLVAADPSDLKELGRIPALNGKTWNHPILVNGRLYLRNAEEIACFALPLETPQALPESKDEEKPAL